MEGIVKKSVIVIVAGAILALVPAGTAIAACGVGTTIWEDNDSTGAKILAFTTNFWTFKGISTTSEISGCEEENNWFKRASNAELREYASQNLDHLASDFARGQGEHLDAIAHLIQLGFVDRDEFRALAQINFEMLFPHDHVTAAEMLGNLRQLMIENDTLASYVQS